ncbi:phosphatase PAP2-related protein [Flavitalea sp. BT771]|uniref:phosphatase PAP2 family protein n=1 Tax=Flavitalea sp. BT771 TaxID=3063329 RepID=UPI0026E47EDA|nr:phosphatase PAP2 family protein [Flavitalea sp. BT771]MDO6431163.1 phosphatase PAP2-related protein [Flavitalea sp. BT771]MDV6220070.1 phosphatase PAP2-related protein [Flavitalea sp. BT771]
MPITILAELREEWQDAWQSAWYRKRVIGGLALVIVILSLFPLFFQTIEKRSGYLLADPLLGWLHPHNVSIAIFVVIWAVTLLGILRAAQDPYMFLTFVWAYILLSVMRTLAITLVPLDPPVGLVGLVDPISNFFYGEKFVTRDLFFSGHTSTVFLIFLCLPGKMDRRLALIGTVAVGYLLLVQHVHYTMDVLGAFVFGWLAFWMARRTVVRPEDRM